MRELPLRRLSLLFDVGASYSRLATNYDGAFVALRELLSKRVSLPLDMEALYSRLATNYEVAFLQVWRDSKYL